MFLNNLPDLNTNSYAHRQCSFSAIKYNGLTFRITWILCCFIGSSQWNWIKWRKEVISPSTTIGRFFGGFNFPSFSAASFVWICKAYWRQVHFDTEKIRSSHIYTYFCPQLYSFGSDEAHLLDIWWKFSTVSSTLEMFSQNKKRGHWVIFWAYITEWEYW